MNLIKLRDKCDELGIGYTNGNTKKQLINKIDLKELRNKCKELNIPYKNSDAKAVLIDKIKERQPKKEKEIEKTTEEPEKEKPAKEDIQSTEDEGKKSTESDVEKTDKEKPADEEKPKDEVKKDEKKDETKDEPKSEEEKKDDKPKVQPKKVEIEDLKLQELRDKCKALTIPYEEKDIRAVLIDKIRKKQPKKTVKIKRENRGRKPSPVSIEDLRNEAKKLQLSIDEFVRQHPELNRTRFNRAKVLIGRIIRQQLR